jgi:uncharacterized protein YndB with AHSA1/START domain
MVTSRKVSATRLIGAPAERIFALLRDPAMHPVIDGSGTVRAVQPGGPSQLGPGTRFGMTMYIGARYKILNTVVEYEPDRLIAWRHFYGHRWRWQLEPAGPGVTEVTETFDWSTARIPLLITMSPFPRRNRAAIEESLTRLQALFTLRGPASSRWQRDEAAGPLHVLRITRVIAQHPPVGEPLTGAPGQDDGHQQRADDGRELYR